MRMLTGIDLITFSPDAHEAGSAATETKRRVKAQELSLTQAEVYQAGGDGLNPEAKLLIPYDRDYKGERELDYKGERWWVLSIDPYKDWSGVILKIRRRKGNTGGAPAEPETETQTETQEQPAQEVRS